MDKKDHRKEMKKDLAEGNLSQDFYKQGKENSKNLRQRFEQKYYCQKKYLLNKGGYKLP